MNIDDEQAQLHEAARRYEGSSERRVQRTAAVNAYRQNHEWGDYDWREVEDPERIRERASFRADLAEAERTWNERGQVQDFEEFLLERVLDESDLVSTDFLRRGARAASCVGKILAFGPGARTQGSGTGFMISDRLMMTNHHVVADADIAKSSKIQFDYVTALTGEVSRTIDFSLAPDEFFVTSPELDYTVVALGPEYNADYARARGWLRLYANSGKMLVGENVNIIQHPQGGSQRVALRKNTVVNVVEDFIHYTADTDRGSSGAPVCNDEWVLAALHKSGVPLTDDKGRILLSDKKTPWDGSRKNAPRIGWVANEGIRISRIVSDVREQLSSLDFPDGRQLFQACFLDAPATAPGNEDAPIPVVSPPIVGGTTGAHATITLSGLPASGQANVTVPLHLSLSISTGDAAFDKKD